MQKSIQIGLILLIGLSLMTIPVLASTIQVEPFGQVLGTLTFTIVPDKAVYNPGDKITYEFTSSTVSADPDKDLNIYSVAYLDVTLDPHITGITVDTGDLGIICTVSGNTVHCDNPDLDQVTWRLDYDYPKISGTIQLGTLQGTLITTSGLMGADLDYDVALYIFPEFCPDTNVVTVGSGPNPSPEFPSIFLPAIMIIGFVGAVLLIQRTKEN